MPDVTRTPADWRSTVGGRIAVEIDALRNAVAAVVDALPFGPLQDDGFCRICARYDGHAADCEWEALALLAGEGTAQPDPSEINIRASGEGTAPQPDLVQVGWLRTDGAPTGRGPFYVLDDDPDCHAQDVADERLVPVYRLADRGTAPQVPAEVLWEGETGYFAVDDFTDSHVDHLTLGVPPGTRVRVVAADDAPQEGDEQ